MMKEESLVVMEFLEKKLSILKKDGFAATHFGNLEATSSRAFLQLFCP
jgi:hypothetical protein